jgi:tetratricopeptide (TPR) repeat protein
MCCERLSRISTFRFANPLVALAAAAALGLTSPGPRLRAQEAGQSNKAQAENEALRKQIRDLQKQVEALKRENEALGKQAEANFRRAREAVDRLLADVTKPQPEADPEQMRKALLKAAREYYQHLRKEIGDKEKNGKGTSKQLERIEQALKELEQTFKLGGVRRFSAELTEVEPAPAKGANDESKQRHEEARKLLAAGEAHRNDGKVTEAHDTWKQAVELLRKVAAASPNVPAYQLDLARGYLNLGELGLDTGRYKEANRALRQAVTVLEKLVTDYPATPAYRRDLARGYTRLADLLQRTGRKREAQDMRRRAAEVKRSAEDKSK